MRYYWLRDRKKQQQFNFYWAPGRDNHADSYTNHHATKHHIATRPKYFRDVFNMSRIFCMKLTQGHLTFPKTKNSDIHSARVF